RATRIIPPALRKALELRDQHCTHPGCQVPARWCDAHHIQHWADGGKTDLSNLRLLCRKHHHDTHHHQPYPRRE
ncbi:MAG: HNH endonuclease, partial [Acidimicrobiia bacterium]|nr:HNH endonuclease [Acidimicrobiia bacterium]